MFVGQGLAFLAMALLTGCIYRLIWLERHRGSELRADVARQQQKDRTYLGRRGSIVDYNPLNPGQHTTLATSYLLDSVFIDVKAMLHRNEKTLVLDESMVRTDEQNLFELADRLASILAFSASERGKLRVKLDAALKIAREQIAAEAKAKAEGRLSDDDRSPAPPPGEEDDDAPAVPGKPVAVNCRYVNIQRMRLISPDQSLQIDKLRAERVTRRTAKEAVRIEKRFPGLGTNAELKRDYPAGKLAAHLIGFVGKDGKAKEGLELNYDRWLFGEDGSKQVIRTAGGHPLWSSERDYLPPRDGLTIVLNINSVIQSNVERVLAETVSHYKAESGTAVVMDVKTGAIWALATVPTFSLREDACEPGVPYVGNVVSEADKRQLRNRALTDPFEPGSIFKWVAMAGAIDQGIIRRTDIIDCGGGSVQIGSRTVHDVHGYGDLTVEMILIKSSNVGMSKIGMKMGAERLYKAVTDFGFGRKTGIDAPGEDPGILKPLSAWKPTFTVPSVSFGQEISVTPVQMAAGFSAICNGGWLLQPRLVRAIVDESAVISGGAAQVVKDYSHPVGRQILKPTTCRTMVEIMCGVVTKGTGQKAKSDKVTIFGKTGTAQIFERGRDTGQFTSSFICGAPAENPQIAVIVSVRKPNRSIGHFGGTVAAPAAKQIVEETLGFLSARGGT